jgi:hypothetical protein
MEGMNTFTYLELSTCYLTQEQGTGDVHPDLIAYEYEYGFFVPVPYDPEQTKNLPPNLTAIMEYSKAHDIRLVRFDCDGPGAPEDSDFPSFEWEIVPDTGKGELGRLKGHLDAIHRLMDGQEWDSDTTRAISEVLTRAAYTARPGANSSDFPSFDW